ncbi:5'-nucleotidase C-terminal domain-containing protein [Halomicroarcula sp. GCM10025709]|uniref:5'-nucleotidase C-terminal domain-containing protein n=1 Tax=Halomicroarcula sp. GCM10025709 TaxID=3252669 RepID=UPI0036098037
MACRCRRCDQPHGRAPLGRPAGRGRDRRGPAGSRPLPGRPDAAFLSGQRLLAALAAVPVGAHADSFPARFCSHVSGARIVFDDAAGELRSATVGGEPVDPDATYTLAVAEYLVETDHVVGVFGPEDIVDRCGIARDAIVEYAREVGIDPAVDGRIERPTLAEH